MLSRKELEIQLSRSIEGFPAPKVSLEQYQTPSRVAANLTHRASYLGDLNGKNVIDIGAGTGMLAIAAALSGAKVTAIELDPASIAILKKNMVRVGVNLIVVRANFFEWEARMHYDTAILNPPFGIQQKKYRDLEFLLKANQISEVSYSILDGSESNVKMLPKLLEKRGIELLDYYIDEFPLENIYPWHKTKRKIHHVMVVKSRLMATRNKFIENF